MAFQLFTILLSCYICIGENVLFILLFLGQNYLFDCRNQKNPQGDQNNLNQATANHLFH